MIIAASAFCTARLDVIEDFSVVRHIILLTDELDAPFLPESSYLSPREADEEFLRVMQSMMRSSSLTEMFEGLTPQTYLRVRVEGVQTLPGAYPFTQADQAALTFDGAVALLGCLSRIPASDSATTIGLSVIVNMIVAICKQGTVSSYFIDKIRHAIQQDIGRSVKNTQAYISGIWGVLDSSLTKEI